MAQENKDSILKWEGKSTAELKNITAEQLWPLLEDFCTIDKWIPVLDSEKCRQVEGVYGEPGLVRYCAFTEESSQGLSKDTDNALKWCNEKLVSMDRVQRTLSYEVTENNIGFKSYVANVKVTEEVDGGCKIDWSFLCDPVEGLGLEDLRGFLKSNVKIVSEGMRTYLSKWEGKSTAELRNITVEKIWPLFEDFCSIYKWLPSLDSEKCRQVEGAYGKPGLVKYCVLTKQSDEAPTMWWNEKLLSMDPAQRTLSYEVTENNLGFKSYIGNVKVVENDGGCKIEWSFVADPVEGMGVEDLKSSFEANLKTLAEGIRKELQAPEN